MTRTVAEIDTAIASIRESMGLGMKSVRYRDGRILDFMSVTDMVRAITELQEERAAVVGNPPVTRVAARYVSGLSG